MACKICWWKRRAQKMSKKRELSTEWISLFLLLPAVLLLLSAKFALNALTLCQADDELSTVSETNIGISSSCNKNTLVRAVSYLDDSRRVRVCRSHTNTGTKASKHLNWMNARVRRIETPVKLFHFFTHF